MPRMGKTEGNWKGLKLGFLNIVQPNSFSKLIPATSTFKNNAQETYLFGSIGSLISSFTCNFFAYFTFHSHWGRAIGKIKQNELDCRDTAPFMCQPEAKGSCAAEQGRVNTWDLDEIGPVWVRIALHTVLVIRLHGTGLKTNSEQSDFVSVADPTRVIFVPVWDCTVLM